MTFSRSACRLALFVALLGLPAGALAQDATLTGTVTDPSGGVLPGVAVTATHLASGNVFTSASDERGQYHFATLRVGQYRMTAELSGFATVTKDGIELLVGQRATLDMQMQLSTVAENVTVAGGAPIIDTTESKVASNIDPRQMQALPINGRNWLDLTIFSPGSRSNSVTEAPLPRDNGSFQLNLDGQQVTSTISASSFGSPHYARDSIAEFQFVTNRFDVTQGRSAGVAVNAVTKSGANVFAGSAYGYFRDSSLNAADFVAHRVLPYSDQQIGGTLGGPIVQNKVQFFVAYEGERQPQTYVFTTPFPAFNQSFTGNNIQNVADVKVDDQLSSKTRLSIRANKYTYNQPYNPVNTGGGATAGSAAHTQIWSEQLFASLNRVISDKTVNEIKGGYTDYRFYNAAYVLSPTIQLTGFTIGNPSNYPERFGEARWSIRDDFTTYHGAHEIKFGGEYLHNLVYANWPLDAQGIITAQRGPIPANITSLFPNLNDPTTWNLAALSPITSQYVQAFGPNYILDPEQIFGVWAQDNWSITHRLTLNLGLRYDVDLGVLKPSVSVPPFLVPGSPGHSNSNDFGDLGPRTGFNYKLTDDGKTLVRGGYGLYFAQVTNNQAHDTYLYSEIAQVFIQNTGAPDFAANPFGGVTPSYALAKQYPQSIQIYAPGVKTPYAHQATVGVQRQVGDNQSITIDYVYTGTRRDWNVRNANLAYDPTTGANLPFTIVADRPYPTFGYVKEFFSDGRSNYNGLQTSWTKRFSNRWQATATYALSKMMDDSTPYSSTPDNSFNMAAEYAPSTADQRHRATFNGIWDLPHDFQVSGVYFFGSGFHFNDVWGGDLRNTGGTSSGRLKPDGTIVPRNSFVGLPIQRMDVRLTKRFNLGGSLKVDAIAELFNVFNHVNYGSYVLAESLATYGQPTQSTDLAYQPRMGQLAIHFIF